MLGTIYSQSFALVFVLQPTLHRLLGYGFVVVHVLDLPVLRLAAERWLGRKTCAESVARCCGCASSEGAGSRRSSAPLAHGCWFGLVAAPSLLERRRMSLWAWLAPTGPNGFGYASTADEVAADCDLSGKRYLLTGCNSGIGFETLRVLTSRGATVLAAARTLDKARRACERAGKGAVPLECELSEPSSVRAAAAAIGMEPLDGVLCNAGIMLPSGSHRKYGHELQFLTNHLGHFLLVTALLPRLATDGRVVCVSSGGHHIVPRGGIDFDNLSGERRYLPWQAYGQSKLANLLFVAQLARRFAGSERAAIGVHPGVVRTELTRSMSRFSHHGLGLLAPLFVKSPAQGAASPCFALVHPAGRALNGAYVVNCDVSTPSRHARDAALAQRLWSVSEELTAAL